MNKIENKLTFRFERNIYKNQTFEVSISSQHPDGIELQEMQELFKALMLLRGFGQETIDETFYSDVLEAKWEKIDEESRALKTQEAKELKKEFK